MRHYSLTAGLLLGLVLSCTVGCSNNGSDDGIPSPRDPSIPSVAEKPPTLDSDDLSGTTWEADLSRAPGKNRSDRIYLFDFKDDGTFTLNTRPLEKQDDEKPSLFDALSKDMGGRWTLEGAQVQIEMPMMGKQIKDSLEIRGSDLYYHGQKMVHPSQGKPGG